MEPLRYEGDRNLLVEHTGAHAIENFGLDHVIAVNNHENVLHRNLLPMAHCRENFVQDDMIEIGGFPVQLPRLLDSVTHVKDVRVACIWITYTQITQANCDVTPDTHALAATHDLAAGRACTCTIAKRENCRQTATLV
jgi:hypothetical protein